MLKLNREAGRHAETAKALHIRNTELRALVSRLSSTERLQREGQRLGLVMPAAGKVRYVTIGRADARRAAGELRSDLLPPPGSYDTVTAEPRSLLPSAPVVAAPAAPGAVAPTASPAPASTSVPPSTPAPAAAAPAAQPAAGQAGGTGG
jgi:hypothetical protein